MSESVHSPTSGTAPSWLLKAKVSTPELGAGHVPRAALLRRLEAALERRFVLLQAPAGFGKTTALADFSRRKREEGLVVAWVSLDAGDVPNVFGGYLACAFERGGLDLSAWSDPDGQPASPETYEVGGLVSAVERHEAPCLLVLDEVDRLPRETVELVQRLVEHCPRNLHFALAFRADPGLDLSMQVLDGAGVVVGAEELRFSRSEMEQFFGNTLSRRRLSAAVEQTAGWPVALTAYRHQRAAGTTPHGAETARLMASFVRRRLLGSLSAADRAFVCELAVFDRIDAELVDEVLGASGSGTRMASLPQLDGLLTPIGPDGAVRQLHPLVREPCVAVLAAEDPVRKRALHTAIAKALAHRGQLAPAWRQARAAPDARLAGELVERAGVFDLWLRRGVPALFAASEFLTPELTVSHPRLVLLRVVVLRMGLKVDEAAALYESVRRETNGLTRDRDGGDAEALAVDRVFARVVLAGGSQLAVRDELDTLLPPTRFADGDGQARLRLRARHMVLCGSSFERARFEECHRHAAMARELFGEERPYGNLVLDLYEGMAAMARGSADEAGECYARARRRTRRDFAADPCLSLCVKALTLELDLECDRGQAVEPATLKALAELRAIWTDVDAVAFAVAAELTFDQQDGEAAIQTLTKTMDEVRAMCSETLSRCVAGLLVHYLVEAGRLERAADVWRDQALPNDLRALLDLDRQPWLTMESQGCARVRLLAAQGDLATAGQVATALCAAAAERGLTRTLLRGLALSMVVAERAGQADIAVSRLVEFLRLARTTGYVRPLVRDREVSRPVLERLLAREADPEVRNAAESMLERLSAVKKVGPVFSSRELQVLAEVRQGLRNGEIAARLGISQPGVRFHLMNIYRKTGVNRREEAVRTAQAMGVLD